MRKLFYLGLIALAGIIIGFAWAEQLTLTTYYPAPYGVYKEMKANLFHANPQSPATATGHPEVPAGEESAWEGKMYYNDGSGGAVSKGVYYYDGSEWRTAFGGLLTWDSGWYPVTAQNIGWPPPPTSLPQTFTHNLGSEALMTQILFAPDDGTGNPDLTKVCPIEYSDYSFAGGRVEVTPTQLIVYPGQSFLFYTIFGAIYQSGFYRVFAIRIS